MSIVPNVGKDKTAQFHRLMGVHPEWVFKPGSTLAENTICPICSFAHLTASAFVFWRWVMVSFYAPVMMMLDEGIVLLHEFECDGIDRRLKALYERSSKVLYITWNDMPMMEGQLVPFGEMKEYKYYFPFEQKYDSLRDFIVEKYAKVVEPTDRGHIETMAALLDEPSPDSFSLKQFSSHGIYIT